MKPYVPFEALKGASWQRSVNDLTEEYGQVPDVLSVEVECCHDEVIWTSYTGGDEVMECAICGEQLMHRWVG